MMDHYGDDVKVLELAWTAKIPTNLDQFRNAKKDGLTDEEAVGQTWSGRNALAYGFKKISFIKNKDDYVVIHMAKDKD